jgi:hypothetical protein
MTKMNYSVDEFCKEMTTDQSEDYRALPLQVDRIAANSEYIACLLLTLPIALYPLLGIMVFLIPTFGIAILATYKHHVHYQFVSESIIMLDEQVLLGQKMWNEHRNITAIREVEPYEVEFEVPDGEWFIYTMYEDKGRKSYYLSPVVLSMNDTVVAPSPSGEDVRMPGKHLVTEIIGSHYDPTNKTIIPIKAVRFANEFGHMKSKGINPETFAIELQDMIADSPPVLDIYGAWLTPERMIEVTETIKDEKQKPPVIISQPDFQGLIQNATEQLRGHLSKFMELKTSSDPEVLGVMHDSSDTRGWAQLDALPQIDDPKMSAIIGYACYNCDGNLKDIEKIITKDDASYFECEYCGSVNRVNTGR